MQRDRELISECSQANQLATSHPAFDVVKCYRNNIGSFNLHSCTSYPHDGWFTRYTSLLEVRQASERKDGYGEIYPSCDELHMSLDTSRVKNDDARAQDTCHIT